VSLVCVTILAVACRSVDQAPPMWEEEQSLPHRQTRMHDPLRTLAGPPQTRTPNEIWRRMRRWQQ
jgi:hypothetical protein